MSVSMQRFRDMLDEMEIRHVVHKDDNMFEFVLHDNEPYDISIKYYFSVNEKGSCIQGQSLLWTYDVDDAENFQKAYRFCNQWNWDTIKPKALVQEKNKSILCEWTWDTNYEITDELLKHLIIGHFLSGSHEFFQKAVGEGLYPELVPVVQKTKAKKPRTKRTKPKKENPEE